MKKNFNEFLDETKGLCWFEYAQKKFQENGFESVDVRIVDEPVITTTTSETVVSTICPTKPEELRILTQDLPENHRNFL